MKNIVSLLSLASLLFSGVCFFSCETSDDDFQKIGNAISHSYDIQNSATHPTIVITMTPPIFKFDSASIFKHDSLVLWMSIYMYDTTLILNNLKINYWDADTNPLNVKALIQHSNDTINFSNLPARTYTFYASFDSLVLNHDYTFCLERMEYFYKNDTTERNILGYCNTYRIN